MRRFISKVKDDSILIERFQNRDETALSKLYDMYSGAIYGVIIRMSRNEEAAQEILQETFIKAWNKSHLYDATKGKFYTWLYRIARNTTLNFLRKKDNLIQMEDLSVYKDEGEEAHDDLHTELKGALAKLDAHHQKALKLIYFNGLTHREAHEEMGVPLGTFKSYVRQAIKKLREVYDQESLMLICILELLA
ncbi:RNA polymerase sigma-70 factor (ECF subfamily) [Kordia periserrulae]|uniref:RNA polymerase sigma factor n=1 Tax=Kordia periserrulae TaxID=701523 RepID=A0A2T6BQX7_9FLAO|nr:sigma-70 family RNA polymerase sigma factor [Kordia periserrulae]PTX58377.1 RNA polymerase sigma-70 factor (ECF subfamily) [Kordia periserrulae]